MKSASFQGPKLGGTFKSHDAKRLHAHSLGERNGIILFECKNLDD